MKLLRVPEVLIVHEDIGSLINLPKSVCTRKGWAEKRPLWKSYFRYDSLEDKNSFLVGLTETNPKRPHDWWPDSAN